MRHVALWSVLMLMGCARTPSGDLKQLQRKIGELTRKLDDSKETVEQINTRLFLLEDKVDTARVAGERKGPPKLRIVRILPTDSDAKPAKSSAPGARPAGSSVVARSRVTYAGEAAHNGPRPVLKLYGSSDEGRVAGTRVGPDPAAVTEKLPLAPVPKRKVAVALASTDSAMTDYARALRDYRNANYAAAITTLTAFIKQRAQHPYADNALYWLGECYYDTKDYRSAIKRFKQVVDQYPQGNKAQDALLKLAYSFIKVGETKNARSVLAQVIETYPASRVAGLARTKLTKLK